MLRASALECDSQRRLTIISFMISGLMADTSTRFRHSEPRAESARNPLTIRLMPSLIGGTFQFTRKPSRCPEQLQICQQPGFVNGEHCLSRLVLEYDSLGHEQRNVITPLIPSSAFLLLRGRRTMLHIHRLRSVWLLAALVSMPAAADAQGPAGATTPIAAMSNDGAGIPAGAPGSGLPDRPLEHLDLHALALSMDDRHR